MKTEKECDNLCASCSSMDTHLLLHCNVNVIATIQPEPTGRVVSLLQELEKDPKKKLVVVKEMLVVFAAAACLQVAVATWCADHHDPVPPKHHSINFSETVKMALHNQASIISINLKFDNVTLPLEVTRAETSLVADGALLLEHAEDRRGSLQALVDGSFAIYTGKVYNVEHSFVHLHVANNVTYKNNTGEGSTGPTSRTEITGIVIDPSRGDAYHILPVPSRKCSRQHTTTKLVTAT